MSNLRQAAQQALEALEKVKTDADKQPPVYPWDIWRMWVDRAIPALHAALAEPEQPHTLTCVCGAGWDIHADGREELAAAPTPRKPLNEDEIVRLMVGEARARLMLAGKEDPEFLRFAEDAIRELVESARAIERAHGIGEQHGS